MADKTLTIVSNGSTKTKTINRDRFASLRTMSVDGQTVTVDRTAPVVTSDRAGESRPLLSKVVGGAAAAYSLRDLNDKQGNNKVVRVRRGTDNQEKDFKYKDIRYLEDWAINVLDDSFNRTASTLKAKTSYANFSDSSNQGTITGNWTNTTKLSVNATGGTRTADKSVTLLHNDTPSFSLGHYEVTFNVTQSGGDDINSAIPFSSRNRIELVTRDTDTTADSNDNLNKQRFAVSTGLNKFRFTLFDDGTTPSKEPAITLVFYRKALFNVEISNIQLRHFTNADGDADAFVATWYDQSGNGRDATQPTIGSQPKIVVSGSLSSDGIDFSPSTSINIPSTIGAASDFDLMSVFAVAKTNDAVTAQVGLTLDSNLFFIVPAVFGDFQFYKYNLMGSLSANTATNLFSITAQRDESHNNRFINSSFLNGELAGTNTVQSVNNATFLNAGIGNFAPYLWDGAFQEVIIYTSSQAANRPAIEANIANQYGITLS